MPALKPAIALILAFCVLTNSTTYTDVLPKFYQLKLKPELENDFKFVGFVQITIEVSFSTTDIVLHCKNLTVNMAKVFRGDNEISSSFELKPKTDILLINTKNYLAYNNEYQLRIEFEGKLNDDLVGFYRSSYKIGQKTKWLATTQFQSNFARMAFPCFDEPRFRTPFQISVARYKYETAISNMPLKATSQPDSTINNRVWDTFETTPPIPTYLLAVVVAEYSFVSSEDAKIKIWARESVIEDARYVLHECQLLLEQLEIYLGISYSLPKLDLVAVPDFRGEAMENWGLNIYRERALLCDETCSRKQYEYVTSMVAHELSHQWFGGYVTPELWNFVWLNEAFATYFKYFIPATVKPSWRMDHLFVAEVTQSAMSVDEVIHYHPLTSSVKTTSEIEHNFDYITYKKGASILRMLEYIVSPSTFRKALRRYLTDAHNSDSTVEPRDLWEAFDKQVIQDKKPLPQKPSEMMDSWAKNRGYPLITVTRQHNASSIIIKQTTYKSPWSSKPTPNSKWTVPVTFTTKNQLNFHDFQSVFWSGLNSAESVQVVLQEDEWILANKLQIGYYRVNYEMENWNLLIKQLHSKFEVIHVLNRAQLIDDAFSLAIDEKLPYQVSFDMANYLDKEEELIPWIPALKHFANIYSYFEHTPIGSTLEDYFLGRISSIYKRIGFYPRPTDNHFMRAGRTTVLSLASQMGNPDCILKSKKLYEKYSDDLSKIPADLKYPVYCSLLSYGNSHSVWSKLWTIYLRTEHACESELVLSVIGCINDEKLIETILNKIIDEKDNDIRKQNIILVLRSVFQTSTGVTAILNFIDNSSQKIKDSNPHVEEKLKSICEMMRPYIKCENQMKLLKTVLSKLMVDEKYKSLAIPLRKAYENGLLRMQMNKKRIDELKNAVESSIQHLPSSKTTTSVTPPLDHKTEKSASCGVCLIPTYISISIAVFFANWKF